MASGAIGSGPYDLSDKMNENSQLLVEEAVAQGVDLDWFSVARLETLVESLQRKYPYRVAR